ncbi:unnamed protein product [Aphanomyces euteiches]
MAYLVWNITFTWLYIDLIHPHLQNDLWWPQFNTTGTQTFISDIFNAKLIVGVASGPFSIVGATRDKKYAGESPFIDVRRTAARRLLLQPFPPETAITLLRQNSFQSNLLLNTPHCWLDLDRRWELAHTAKRQARCLIHDRENAAVYLEAILRNSHDWTTSQHYTSLEAVIFNTITTTPAGNEWLQAVVMLSLRDEVISWQKHNLTSWTGQLQNFVQEGFDDSIVLVNALGVEQRIKIASIANVYRGIAGYTTGWACVGLIPDLLMCQNINCSLVRNSTSHPNQLGLDWDKDIYNGNLETPGSRLIRTILGPYASIDLRFVQPPLSLLTLFTAFEASFNSPPHLEFSYKASPVDVVPKAWQSQELVFYGGNPLCPFGLPQTFVQHSFGYYDDCGSQDPHMIDLTSHSTAFAISAAKLHQKDIAATCRACVTTSEVCMNILVETMKGITEPFQPDLVDQAERDIVALGLTTIQMATNTTNNTDIILTQDMIAAGDPWSFFGWVAMWEWVDGQREVIIFEGDESSMTIISRPYGYQQLPANRLELPHVACQYIRGLVVYVSAVLSAMSLALTVFAAAARFDIDGKNLFFINRVVGSVWIGRPLIFLRGVTAILILSTASVDFHEVYGIATITSREKSVFEIGLLASESTWVVYVLNDLFLPMTTDLSKLYAPLSSALAFVIVSEIEISQPFQMTANISRECTFTSLMSGVVCKSGVVSVGSSTYTCIFFAVHLGCVVLAYAFTKFTQRRRSGHPRAFTELAHHISLPATATAFFTIRDTPYNLDSIGCVMSGIIPVFGGYMDVKLWLLIEEKIPEVKPIGLENGSNAGQWRRLLPNHNYTRFRRVWTMAGLAYICLSIVNSYTFLSFTEATMANDFWWATFDLNNTQAYLCNWFNVQLMTTSIDVGTLQLNEVDRALLTTMENTTDPNVKIAPAYVNMIQDEVNSLPNVIFAIRNMNSCDLPWIFSAYCFVDFDQRWELANSRIRQERCRRQYATNGGVFLEGLFRNNRQISQGWGDAWESAVFNALRESNAGLAWLERTFAADLPIGDEVTFWQNYQITSFVTQWQNFKSLGVVETMDISNALGLSYTITLKKSNGTLQFSKQTSYKMYWGLAGDLFAISKNGSSMSGLSLVRQARNFIFQNSSLEVQLMDNQTLPTPLPSGLKLVRDKLGPFGSIDMYRVAVPLSLKQLYQNLTQALAASLANSMEAQLIFWSMYTTVPVFPQPSEWDGLNYWGGNIMCPEQSSPLSQLQVFFSSQGSCGVSILEYTMLTTEATFQALVATGIIHDQTQITNIESTCQRATTMVIPCINFLQGIKSFAESHIMSLEHAIAAAQQIKKNDVNLQLFQYISQQVNSEITISTPSLFGDADYEFFAWSMLFDWVKGVREVVSFQGDYGQLTLMSTQYSLTTTPADAMEVPLNLALYVHRIVEYFTLVLLCIAVITVYYIFQSRGYIEGLNLFAFNRVAGLVWLGRPLMFVRGVTAICLLSTASLELRRPHAGLVAFLDRPPVDPIKTFFSAGESTWLVYLLNDVFSLVTCQYTTSYSVKSSLLLWAAAAVWSYVSPVSHSVDIRRVCSVVSVDSQSVCQSGVVRIGDSDRFAGLICLAIGCCVLSYAFERIYQRQTKQQIKETSLFVHAAAKYQFCHDEWTFMKVDYVDRASAVLNGILTLTHRDFHYVFDIKTWRLHVYPVEVPPPNIPTHLRYAFALPQ